MISFELGEDLEAIVEMVHELAVEEIRPRLREFEEARGLPDDLLSQVHEMGLTTLALPEDLGGGGMDTRTAAVVCEELAFGDVGASLALSGPGAAGWLVMELADPAQRQRLLQPFTAENGWQRRAAVAAVEGPLGLTPDAIDTVARRSGDGYTLHGTKRYVLNGDRSDLTLVLAMLEDEQHRGWAGLRTFAVEGRPQGLKASEPNHTLGLETARFVTLELDAVEVPSDAMLGSGDDASREALHRGLAGWKLMNSARLVGCMRAASEYAFKYATEREAFGKKLYEHQGLAFLMADMATEVEAVRWGVWRAAWKLDTGQTADAETAVASNAAAELATKVTSDAVQVLGGHGYINDHPVEKWMRDARCLGLVHGIEVLDAQSISEGELRS